MEFPEHEKLKLISRESQAIGEFIDWLEAEKGIQLAEWMPPRRMTMLPISVGMVTLLAEYFEIDQGLIETEKRAMLEMLRQQNAKAEATHAI